MNRPTIFLDLDGVLATVKQYSLSPQAKTWVRKYDVYPFDVKCVKIFNEILEKTEADIIISSDWRNYFSMDELCDIFNINGIVKGPVGSTPIYPTSMSNFAKNRSGEILEYVREMNVEHWMAIDDEDMSYYLGDHFFRCKSEWQGIKQTGLKQKILKYLL